MMRSGLFARLRTLVLPFALAALLAACDSPEERVAEHYERGQKLLEEGAPDKAILEFSNALKLDEDHVPSLFAVAGILEARGDFKGAFARYKKVGELDPGHAAARLKTARFYVLGHEIDKAKTDLAASLQKAPDEAEAHALAAIIALREGDEPAARAAIEKAKGLAPMNAEVLLAEIGYLRQSAGVPAALVRTDEAIAAHPKNLPFYLVKLQMLQEQGDQTALGAHLGAIIDAFPEEPRFRELRARWALRNEDYAAAEAELRGIVTALPDNNEAITNLVGFLRKQHGDAAAREELTRQIAGAENAFPLELMLAQFDIETGQTEAAIGYLRDLIGRAGPNANEARILLARLLIREGQEEGAQTLVGDVLASDANNVEALVLRTARLIDKGELDQALQTARVGLTESPDDVRLLLLAGRVHELSGNLNLASDRYAKAVRVSEYLPANVTRYVQFLARDNRVQAAATVLAEAVERRPDDVQLLDLLAGTRIQLEDWTGARTAIAALAQYDAARARRLRAALLIGQERFGEGQDLLRDLSGDGREQTASLTALIQTYLREGQVDEARAFLDEILEQNPENLQALGLRGNLHLAEEQPDAARALYDRILALDPGNVGAHSAIARIAEAGGDIEGAMEAVSAGLAAAPDNALLLTRLAMLTERQGDFDKAIGLYGQVYERLPDTLLVANNLASLLADHQADDPDALDRAYRIAGRLRNASSPFYRDTYGWTRYLKGEYQEARRYLSTAAESLPDNPWIRYHAGMTEAALKNADAARTHLERALELGGADFPPAAMIRDTLAGLGQ